MKLNKGLPMFQADSRPPRGGRGLKYAVAAVAQTLLRRPPRGGRGLKYFVNSFLVFLSSVAPLAGGVD